MSVKPVTFYVVSCDADGCTIDTPSLGSDYAAWSDEETAVEEWVNADGQVLPDGRAMCRNHRVPECSWCGEWHPTLTNDEQGEPVCPRCRMEKR